MKATPVISSRLLSAAVIATLAGGVGFAPAQGPSAAAALAARAEAGVDVAELIRSLDSEQWAARQRAEDALREALVDLATLEKALEEIEHELSHEARRRLTNIGEEIFLQSPRPGVGISFSRDSAGDGVRIENTVAGFDADEHLKRGDTIIAFGGLPTPNEEEMRTAIMVHDPEDVVELTVRRGNEIVPIQLRLGWFRDLNPVSARQPDKAAMRRAWAIRCAEHLASGQPEDVAERVDLTQALWQGADVVTNQARLELQQRRRPRAVYVPDVTVPGAPAEEERVGVTRRADADAAGAAAREQFLRTLEQRVAAMSERITSLETTLERLNGESPEVVEQIEQEIQQLEMRREELLGLLDRP